VNGLQGRPSQRNATPFGLVVRVGSRQGTTHPEICDLHVPRWRKKANEQKEKENISVCLQVGEHDEGLKQVRSLMYNVCANVGCVRAIVNE
jgi:hypothetical protein